MRDNCDEKYVLDLCDKIVGKKSSRQYRFDFLLGDTNGLRKPSKLPVDAYYSELNLVIEYKEKQHSEEVPFFDKKDKITVSNVHRGEQRKIYDQRRREVLSTHGIKLLEISYLDLSHDNKKRLLRLISSDKKILQEKLFSLIGMR